MSRTDPQFNLRIPADLKTQVEEAAKVNKRSATAEIIARLDESFSPLPPLDGTQDAAFYRAGRNFIRLLQDFLRIDLADLEANLPANGKPSKLLTTGRRVLNDLSAYDANLVRMARLHTGTSQSPPRETGAATAQPQTEAAEILEQLMELNEKQAALLEELSRLQ